MDVAEPNANSGANGIEINLKRVIRDDTLDSLGFEIQLGNKTDKDFFYDPEGLAVRVGNEVYQQSVSDAGGLVPSGKAQTAFFIVTGSATGVRNDLAVTNKFEVVLRPIQGEGDPLSPTNLKWSFGRSKGKATRRKGRPPSGRNRLVRCRRQSPMFPATKATVGIRLRFLPGKNTECGRKLRTSRSLTRHRKPKKSLSMLNRKTLSVTLVALVSIVGTFLYTMWQHNGPGKIANRQAQLAKDLVKVTEPMTSTLRNFNPVAPSVVKPRREVPPPVQVAVPRGVEEAESSKSTVSRTLTIFAAQEQPDKPRSGPHGDYAPAFRLVKCQLVNTVD